MHASKTAAFFLAFLMAQQAHAAERWLLRVDGYGPLRYGMTKAHVQRVVGGLNFVGAEGCDAYEVSRRPEINSVTFMSGKLVALGASAPRSMRTSDGLSIGDQADSLVRVYGDRMVKEKDHDQPEDDPSYWTATILRGKFFRRYYVANDKIESIESGLIAADGHACPD